MEALSGIPTMPDPTHVQDDIATVGDDHDHAEGRGLPVVRALGDIGAGWGLVPPGAVVWFRTLAEVTAAGAGWTRETTLDGLFPIGAGTTFSQTFAEATSYGSSWAHLHTGPSHQHTGPLHTHAGPSHTHDMQNHTHNLNSHVHAGPSHTHDLSNHVHSGPSHQHTVSNASFNLAAGATVTMVGTQTNADGTGNTGAPSSNTSGAAGSGNTGGPSNNDSSVPSSNTTTNAGTGNTAADGTGLTGSAGTGDTSSTSWIPPSRCGIYARKL